MSGLRSALVSDLTRSAFGAIIIEKKNGTAGAERPTEMVLQGSV
jgi:hypothetical protein